MQTGAHILHNDKWRPCSHLQVVPVPELQPAPLQAITSATDLLLAPTLEDLAGTTSTFGLCLWLGRLRHLTAGLPAAEAEAAAMYAAQCLLL